MAEDIPVIDFANYGLGIVDSSTVKDGDLQALADQVCNAFSTVGFCYIKNHGISESKIEDALKISKDFFEQPESVKQKYARPKDANHGWVAVEREKLNPERPVGDLKEAYNFTLTDDVKTMPEDLIPEFHQSLFTLFNDCARLSERIFDVMSIGLKLPERKFLRDCHRFIGQKGNQTTLRTLYYPTVKEIKPGQMRCGEHSDYGTVTLLFQTDDGLEVMNREGRYISASPIPGTVLVNIGDLMQRWTADKLLATKHLVKIPGECMKNQGRQSIAFFIHPDDEVIVKCLDGSDKYEPITSIGYLNMRFGVTY